MVSEKFVNTYSTLERLLHKAAFASGTIQVSLADIEDRLLGEKLSEISVDRPIFIAALPRAGTTILLSLLHQTGEFASHTYENMPFILCPIFWQRLSASFRSNANVQMERAHGDGISISVTSPEAFEEVIWHQFWPDQYQDYLIKPWAIDRHLEFESFFRNHIRKQILISTRNEQSRYLSKNNLNIARLEYIHSVFPESIILVPFREPLQHAASLLNQHLNFLETHKHDAFSKSYMKGIGHFDFGENLRPVDFGDWIDRDRREDARFIDFWLEYWIAAYEHISERHGKSIRLISYENMTKTPKKTLGTLASAVKLRQPEFLVNLHTKLRQPSPRDVERSDIADHLLDKAYRLHEKLNTLAEAC